MTTIDKTWNWLNGKKTYIGIILGAAWVAVQTKWPDALPESLESAIEYVLITFFGVGLGHKAKKAVDKYKANSK